jgi:acyl transferase domain-containing protein
MESVIGSKTSVFIGNFTREYEIFYARDPEQHYKYLATGTGAAMFSNRLSWFYDFTGPSLTIDTACSSSLNALHLGYLTTWAPQDEGNFSCASCIEK